MSSWFFKSYQQSSPPKPRIVPPAQTLSHFQTGSPPPSARVDLKLQHKPRRPLRLWDYWKFGFIVAAKATEVTSDVLTHHIWGPRRKSWGIEMTIVTSIIRGAERHSWLVDIGTIRKVMSIGGLVPLPSDALVTPVTFKVKKRDLRGLLAEHDAVEDGTRELSGEWVVGRKTWQRMQEAWKARHAAGQRPSTPEESEIDSAGMSLPKRKERVVLYIHGGAYYLSSAAAQRIISIPLAKYTDARVFALNYRLAPETHFPGPIHDVVSAYFRLVDDLHIPCENIIVAGDSAGGALTIALLLYLRDNNYPMPSGAILMSPWVDLTMSCESWDSNAPYDVVPFPAADNHMHPIALYLGERTEEYLTHPYASPLFGDLQGLPPLLIQAGDAAVLRDEIALLAHKATLAGVTVMHELYEDAIHVFQAYPFLDASKQAFSSMRDFVHSILPRFQTLSPRPGLLGAQSGSADTGSVADIGEAVKAATFQADNGLDAVDNGRVFTKQDLLKDEKWASPACLKAGNTLVPGIWKSDFKNSHSVQVEGVPYLPTERPSTRHSTSVPAPSLRPPGSVPLPRVSSSAASSTLQPRIGLQPRRIKSTTSLILAQRLGGHFQLHNHAPDEGSGSEQAIPPLLSPEEPSAASAGRKRRHSRTPPLISAVNLAISPLTDTSPESAFPVQQIHDDPPLRLQSTTLPSGSKRHPSSASLSHSMSTTNIGGSCPRLREGVRWKKRKDLDLSVRALIGIRRQVVPEGEDEEGVEHVRMDDPTEVIRSLVDDWRRMGPANETTVFSAAGTPVTDV